MADLQSLRLAREFVDHARRIVVFTGAGISTDSGIPDFRGPNGVWTRNPKAEQASNIRYWLSDPEVRAARWEHMARQRSSGVKLTPNAGHFAVADLHRSGRLDLLVTQNVDGLHQAAGLPDSLAVEVHGCTRLTRCLDCSTLRPIEETLDRFEGGDRDPKCLDCLGMLKTATISFGQSLVEEDLTRAFDAVSQCDLLIAVGSTLSVYPIAGIVPEAKQNGAKIVIVNALSTEMDDIADVLLRDSISKVLPLIFASGLSKL